VSSAVETKLLTIGINDARYPTLLRQILKPPQQLYALGNVDLLQHPYLLAVVGSRRANEYGKRAAQQLLPPVIRAGVILVSGLAHGIDSLAHHACVELGSPTIAVLGSGTDEASLYPQTNIPLMRKIVETGGLVISEYPPGTKALLHHFPARNRIVAGIARATFIMQAAQRSGSLITGRLALESNRDVLALPGNITDPLAAGTNALIRDGAQCVLEAQDILDAFDLEPEQVATHQAETIEHNLTTDQALLLKHLSTEPMHIDVLIAKSHLPVHTISATLLELELLGTVEQIGGMRYIRK